MAALRLHFPAVKAAQQPPPLRSRWSRWRHGALVLLTAMAGGLFVRSGYTTLRDRGPSFWILSLMLCVLAAASWTLTVGLVRARRATRGSTRSVPHTQTSDGSQSGSGEVPPAGASASTDGPSAEA